MGMAYPSLLLLSRSLRTALVKPAKAAQTAGEVDGEDEDASALCSGGVTVTQGCYGHTRLKQWVSVNKPQAWLPIILGGPLI